MTFFDTAVLNFYNSAVLQGMTSGFLMLVYLTTVFQICRFHIVEWVVNVWRTVSS